MSVQNLDFGPKTCNKEKGDDISNRKDKRQVTTIGVDSKEVEEGGVGSRAGGRKRQTAVVAAIKGTITVTAVKATLNS